MQTARGGVRTRGLSHLHTAHPSPWISGNGLMQPGCWAANAASSPSTSCHSLHGLATRIRTRLRNSRLIARTSRCTTGGVRSKREGTRQDDQGRQQRRSRVCLEQYAVLESIWVLCNWTTAVNYTHTLPGGLGRLPRHFCSFAAPCAWVGRPFVLGHDFGLLGDIYLYPATSLPPECASRRSLVVCRSAPMVK